MSTWLSICSNNYIIVYSFRFDTIKYRLEALSDHVVALFAGTAMKNLVDNKGIIVRFVIGRRYSFGGSNSNLVNASLFTSSDLTAISFYTVQIVETVWIRKSKQKALRPMTSSFLYVELLITVPYKKYLIGSSDILTFPMLSIWTVKWLNVRPDKCIKDAFQCETWCNKNMTFKIIFLTQNF